MSAKDFDIPVYFVGSPSEPISGRQLKRRWKAWQKKALASLPHIIIRPKNAKGRTIKHTKLMDVSLTPRGMEIGFVEEAHGLLDADVRPNFMTKGPTPHKIECSGDPCICSPHS